MRRYILAHDLGSSGNKATLFDEKGRMVASKVSHYAMNVFNQNWAEQDPEVWWKAVCESSKSVLSQIDPKEVAAVSFSGQMMGCLCVDKDGRPLYNSLLYCDQRSTEQAEEMIKKVGFNRIYQICGHRPSASYSLSKLMWIRAKKPEVFEKTYKILQAKDYMNFRLTGNFATDYNDASGTNAFDLHQHAWSHEILDPVGISVDKFPEAVPSYTRIGKVTKAASMECGIPEGTDVIVGSGDGGCASMGAGSVSFGKPYCYMGSSSWVSIASKAPVDDPDMIAFTWAHPAQENLYQPCATMQTAGASISWFARTFMGDESGKTLDRMNTLSDSSPIGSNGLFYLPYLVGERSPWWNPKAKGGFIGLTAATNINDCCKALFEGIAMNLGINISVMLKEVPDRDVMFIGGGALNMSMRQLLADVFDCRIIIPQFLTEATSMGAALLGGVGCGLYKDYSIIESMNPIQSAILPDMHAHEFYQKHTELFKQAYKGLEEWFNVQ